MMFRAFTLPMLILAGTLSSGCAVKQLRTDLAAAKDAETACQAAQASQAALAEQRANAYRDIAKKLRAAFGDDAMPMEIRNGRLVVKLSNSILFDSGKTDLKPEGKAALDKIATVLNTVPGRRFMVAGHTDNRPVSDKSTEFATNWELSTQRALAATYYLESKGVDPKRMAAAGYGEHQPLVPNSSDTNRAKNRRTEIVILPTLDEIPVLPKEI